MKTVRCSFNNIHQNRKNLPRNKDDAYAHEVTERSAVPERSEVVWFLSAPIIIPSLHFSPNPNKYPVMERDPVFLTLLKISGFSPWAAPSV